MMVNLMRTNQRWLMIIIIFLVSVSLIVFYSNRPDSRPASDQVGSLYGRSVSASDFGRIQRGLDVARTLGTYDVLLAVMEGGYSQQDDAISAINYLVLEHEAERLGIHPPDEEEIRAAGERLPAFQGPNGEYDPRRQAEFVDSQLNYRGLAPNQIDELVKMNLMVEKLRSVVTATAVVSPQEVRTSYEQLHARTDASVLRLKAADYANVPEPSEDEIKKYFNDQKDQFKQPERRKVQYVKFGLDDAQQKLEKTARMDALKPIADQAEQLLEKLLDQKGKNDFATAAAAEKLPVQETPDFEEDQAAGYPEAALPGFAQAAFKLTVGDPDSDAPLEVPPGNPTAFYDLHLSSVTPERPLTLDEARPRIVTAMKAERASAALTAKAQEIRAKITEGMHAGQSFADAAKAAGQAVQELPPFSLDELNRKPQDLREVASAAIALGIGGLGPFTPDNDGGFLVYVRGRTAPAETKFKLDESSFAAQLQSRKSNAYFREWLRASRDSAKPQFNLRAQS